MAQSWVWQTSETSDQVYLYWHWNAVELNLPNRWLLKAVGWPGLYLRVSELRCGALFAKILRHHSTFSLYNIFIVMWYFVLAITLNPNITHLSLNLECSWTINAFVRHHRTPFILKTQLWHKKSFFMCHASVPFHPAF